MACGISLQWVGGDAKKAEESYFKINQGATLIDRTELRMIKGRHKANVLATRALMRAGTGHNYWSSFSSECQADIIRIAQEVHEGLFKPAMEEPLKTTDLPVAGRGYSAEGTALVMDLVNFINGVQPDLYAEESKRSGRNVGLELVDDEDGSETLKYLKAVQRAASLISGIEPQSLGLNPLVYFYGIQGRFHPSAFMPTVVFVQHLVNRKQLRKFTDIRANFEAFLISHRHYLSQILSRSGGGSRRPKAIIAMYKALFTLLTEGRTGERIVENLRAQPELAFLEEPVPQDTQTNGKKFSTRAKSEIFIRQTLPNLPKCHICGAALHLKSISIDHKKRKEDGGTGSPDNGQLTHPYCNTGYKEQLHAKRIKA